ncbi:MAG: hypothetical protein WC362_08270 [Methanoregula sp.]
MTKHEHTASAEYRSAFKNPTGRQVWTALQSGQRNRFSHSSSAKPSKYRVTYPWPHDRLPPHCGQLLSLGQGYPLPYFNKSFTSIEKWITKIPFFGRVTEIGGQTNMSSVTLFLYDQNNVLNVVSHTKYLAKKIPLAIKIMCAVTLFWCSRSFGMQNPLLRRLLGRWMLRSNSYWKIQSLYRKWKVEELIHAIRKVLHLPIKRFEPVVQDVEIPIEKSLEFMEFYFREIDIRPCWICPVRPLDAARNWTLFAMEPGTLYLNFGFWGSVRTSSDKVAGHFNRRIERIVQELGGHKSLYSTSFFTEDEFWRIYNGVAYKKLKSKFDPQGAFRNLYQKAVLGH